MSAEEYAAEVDSLPRSDTSQTLPQVPDRPGDTAAKAQWLEYAKALGLDTSGAAAEWTRTDLITWCDGGSVTD